MKKIVVIGSLNMDAVAHADHTPAEGETIMADFSGYFPGGKGANQACAIGKLGGEVCMLGAVGCDDAGEALIKSLQRFGVDTSCLKHCEDTVTGQAWITVNAKGNNSIVVLPGANARVDRAYIDSVRAAIEAADAVVMQLEIPVDTVCYAAKLAKEMGKPVVLDPAPARADLPEELLACADYIKPNETELALLTGCSPAEYEKGARILLEKGVKNVVVSLGEKGVYCLTEKESFLSPARKVKAVDTTAAGDSFLASFTLALVQGQALREAIDFAQRVAAIVVTRPGAQDSIPGPEEL